MMDSEIEANVKNTTESLFDSIRHLDNRNIEYWKARELAEALGYEQWRNFENVIEKAKTSISNSGISVENHFVETSKMVQVGSNTMRQIKDMRLSRYACYIISQNGDSTKNEIALAQAYFAQQTRKQELLVSREKQIERVDARHKLSVSDREFSSTAMGHGVDRQRLAIIKSEGDTRLFGGKSTQEMKAKYGIKDKKKPLADHLPTISLTAKQLANEMTTLNTKSKDLRKDHVGIEHLKNNVEIRKSLLARGIKLEDLPPEEDIKQVERRLKAEKKRLDKAE